MIQRTRYVDVAKGRNSVSAATITGAMLGDKTSGKKVRNTIFNTGQRTYQRKVMSWFCHECATKEPKVASGSGHSIFKIIGVFLFLILFFPTIRDFTIGFFYGLTEELSAGNMESSSSEKTLRAVPELPENAPEKKSAGELSSVSLPSGVSGNLSSTSEPRMAAPLYDTDFFGGDIFPYGMKNMPLEKCLDWCLDNVQCKGISFVPSRQECYPKREITTGRASPGVISSLRF